MNQFLVIAIFSVIVALVVLAVYKLVKSAIPDFQKVKWVLAFIVFNVLAAIPFIIYHDYFLKAKTQE